MLTKSQARTFFLVGTGLCTAAFLGLTVDSFRQLPRLTHAERITPEVIRGKHLWESSNCMGCHTLFGEGSYYAPELTKVYERRGELFIRSVIRDPAAMYPGQRRMQSYGFSEPEIEALLQFLKWAGEVDLNGFPAKPTLAANVVSTASAVPALPRPLIFTQVCSACHSLGGQGGAGGPALDGVGSRFEATYLRRWLADPTAMKPATTMPRLPLSEAQIDELVSFLASQKG